MPGFPVKAKGPAREKIVLEHSSWLAYADYDPVEFRLEVGFKNGKVVEHWPVYPQTFLDFKLAPSKGSYYVKAIKKTAEPAEIKA